MVNTEAYALEKLTNDITETHPITYKTISHNVWALCCSGDHDLCIPFPGTEAWVRSIGYQVVDRWRPWYFGDQVAGYGVLNPFFALLPWNKKILQYMNNQ